MNQNVSIPLIKEHRVRKIIEALKCIEKYPYNRGRQRACILQLYPDKTEKSVFRGMIIPTLRYLGLILGHGKAIRVSCNGKLIVEGSKKGESELNRVNVAVFLEIDKNIFHFVEKLRKNKAALEKSFIESICQRMDNSLSKERKEERIRRWLNVLIDSGLIKYMKEKRDIFLSLNTHNYAQAKKDLDFRPKTRLFRKVLFETYLSISRKKTAGIVDIPLLRELVGVKFYRVYNMILTENQFDELLRRLPLVTDKYVISLGQPMGAEEKLFQYKGNYYRTLSITFFKEEGEAIAKR